MTDNTRYVVAAIFFVIGTIVMAMLLAQLPQGTAATSFLVTTIGWYVLYPVARLTWARNIAEWRYWLIGALMSVTVPIIEGARRAQLGPEPSPILQWLTAAIMIAVLVAALVRMRSRRQ
jgi:hypothetical protein